MPTVFPTVWPMKLRSRASAPCSFARSPIYATRLYSRRRVDVRASLVLPWQVEPWQVEQWHGDRGVTDGVVHGRTVDLSRTGAGLTLTRELAAGTEVVLCLNLPCGKPLRLRAVVIRRSGFRAGLQFVEPTAEQRLLLLEFCCC